MVPAPTATDLPKKERRLMELYWLLPKSFIVFIPIESERSPRTQHRKSNTVVTFADRRTAISTAVYRWQSSNVGSSSRRHLPSAWYDSCGSAYPTKRTVWM